MIANAKDATGLSEWSLGNTCRATLVVSLMMVGAWLLYQCHQVLFLVFIGYVLSITIRPIIEQGKRLGLAHSTSTLLVFITTSITIFLACLTIVPTVYHQALQFNERSPTMYAKAREYLLSFSSEPLQRILGSIPESLESELPVQAFFNRGLLTVRGATEYSLWFEKTSFAILAVALFAFYWSLHEERTIRSALLWLPDSRRESAKELIEAIRQKVGAYVRGQGIVCVSVAILALIAYWMIGLPYFLALALVAGILEAVPVFGPTLGAIPAILTAVSVDPAKVPWVIGVAFTIQQIENYFLIPRVMNRSVGVNPLVTLLSIVAFGSLLGPIGAVLAIPMAAIIQLFFDRFVVGNTDEESRKLIGRNAVSRLKYEAHNLVQAARTRFRETTSDPAGVDESNLEETVEAIASDLERFLAVSVEERSEPDLTRSSTLRVALDKVGI